LLINNFRFYAVFLGYILIVACSSRLPLKQPINMPPIPPAPEFETAIRGLTNDLLRQVENHQRKSLQEKKVSESELPKVDIVLRSFSEADTGYTVTLSKAEETLDVKTSGKNTTKPIGKNNEELIYSEAVERETCQDEFCPKEGCQKELIIFSEVLHCQKDFKPVKRFEKLSILPLSQESLKQAKYFMYGIFRLEPATFIAGKTVEKRYHVHAVIVDEQVQPKVVVAKADVWIANKMVHLSPTKEGVDSPVYLRDTGLEQLVRFVITSRPGDIVNSITSSEVDAIMADASQAYAVGKLDSALELYNKVAQRPDGRRLGVYSALFQIYYQQGNMTEAKEALRQMTALGVAEMKLDFKFLFKVNSVEFGRAKSGQSETEETSNWIRQYPFWIEAVGEYFEKSSECVEIIGYASRTGNADYNRKLSLNRATRIKTLIIEKFRGVNAKVSSVQGKGFDECELSEPRGICLGTDDERDAYDRRVEFKILNCSDTMSN